MAPAQPKAVPVPPPVYRQQARAGMTPVQCKRPWQEKIERAEARLTDLNDLYQAGTGEFATAAKQLRAEGVTEDTKTPEPRPESNEQKKLNDRAVALYEWVKEVNSTSAGKLYEMVTHGYHRQLKSRYVWPGISNTDDPDLYVYVLKSTGPLGGFHRRAEEVKMVSVENPSEVKSQAESAARQLEKARATTDYHGGPIDQWKSRIRIRDEENPWPGTASSPPTANNFRDKLIDQLLHGMKWIAWGRPETHMTVEHVNDPTISAAQHRSGTRRDILRVEAWGHYEAGAMGHKTKRSVKFLVFNTQTGQQIMEQTVSHDTAVQPHYHLSSVGAPFAFSVAYDRSGPFSPWNQ
jgi:hypothetical protein